MIYGSSALFSRGGRKTQTRRCKGSAPPILGWVHEGGAISRMSHCQARGDSNTRNRSVDGAKWKQESIKARKQLGVALGSKPW